MPGLKYQCTNLAEECNKAVTGEKIEIPEGDEALCPECQRPLTPAPPEKNVAANRFIIAGIAGLLLILMGLIVWRYSDPGPKPIINESNTHAPAAGNKCGLVAARPPDVARLLQYLKQGMMFGSQGKYGDAIREFKTGLEIDGNFLALHGNAGWSELRIGKFSDAKIDLEAELKLDDCLASMNDDQLAPFAYYMEVSNTTSSRQKAQAEKLALRVKEVQGMTHYSLACLYSRQREADRAIAQLQQALDAGYKDARSIKTGADLAFARGTPGYGKILDQL